MDKDDRFKHIVTDPKFRRIPKSERKVKIDKRFQSMFKDEQFKVKYTIDKRGRPVNHTSTEDLKRYYDLSSDESKSSDSENEEEDNESGKFVKALKSNKDELKAKLNVDKVIPKDVKVKLKDLSVDYARGEGALLSESSSDDESESEASDNDVDHGWGELDKDADKTDNISNRLAVCNQDWDRIRATDLMVLFNSFLPPGGVIHSITIYPSDFGLQRMQDEEVKGPMELTDGKREDSDCEENEEGSKYHMEKLRQYQLNRLKYYYAVVICDCAETANKIYTECDGLEYESSATKIDLRFIPDGTEFENEAKEICDKMPEKYTPRFFTTTALQQAKVELTWDETDPERLEIAKKFQDGKIDDVTETDLQAYLASSSGEDSDEETEDTGASSDDESNTKNPMDKYRALLQDIENTEKEKDNKGVEMEVTWGLNMKEKSQKLVKKKLAETEDKTPFQQFLDKRKEKKKTKREERKKKIEKEANSDDESIPSDIDMNDPYFAEEFDKPEFKKKSKKQVTKEVDEEVDEQKKAELELLLLNENEDTRKHFSLKKIQEQETQSKKKRKNKKKKNEEPKVEDDFELNVKDDRFSALYSSHHFNIDPTDSHFKKTKAMEALIEEKLKRRAEDGDVSVSKRVKLSNKKDAELSVLVKSVKRKTQALQTKK